jgi:uncharacterized protein (TIGR03435 family)
MMSGVAGMLETALNIPVIDHTGTTNRFDFDFSYRPGASVEEIKQAALDQLGLKLTPAPTKQLAEFLVVEKSETKK